jgi:hypothetical protein
LEWNHTPTDQHGMGVRLADVQARFGSALMSNPASAASGTAWKGVRPAGFYSLRFFWGLVT